VPVIAYGARAAAVLHRLLLAQPAGRPFLLPANVCPVVPLTFLEAGRPFLFVDVEEPSLEMDHDALLAQLRRDPGRTGGVVFVRPYGAIRDVDCLFGAVKEAAPGTLLIDDRCLGEPDLDGSHCSPHADATLFSTGPRKAVDVGFGGFAHLKPGVPCAAGRGAFVPASLTSMEELFRRAVAAGERVTATVSGWLDERTPQVDWQGYRALVGPAAAGAAAHRREINAHYTAAIPAEHQLPARFHGWRFQVRVPAAEALLERLFAAGLFASRHFAPLGQAFGGGPAPVAERLHGEVVNLFNDRNFDIPRARRVTAVVRDHLASATR
jgi:dTDP-4-amino-4,6-dideoxygalactose transaminase